MVTNKNGEYRKINFPQGILVGRYSPSNNKSIYYAPNPIEQFFINLKFKKEERSDLAELITIKQLGTNALLLMLKKQTIPKMTDTLYEPPSTSLSAAFNADAASILGRSK
jgi:hypothetical protein